MRGRQSVECDLHHIFQDKQGHPSVHLPPSSGWKVDVMMGALAATLNHEAQGETQKIGDQRIWGPATQTLDFFYTRKNNLLFCLSY